GGEGSVAESLIGRRRETHLAALCARWRVVMALTRTSRADDCPHAGLRFASAPPALASASLRLPPLASASLRPALPTLRITSWGEGSGQPAHLPSPASKASAGGGHVVRENEQWAGG